MTEQYRNLVIGSGEGGKVLAWTLAKAGEQTIVVERAMVGGSCPNVACLPSKTSSSAPRRCLAAVIPSAETWQTSYVEPSPFGTQIQAYRLGPEAYVARVAAFLDAALR